MPGTLILCAGPIGNLGDAPRRLAEALGRCDVVFAEDTRRSRILLDHLGLSLPLRSFFAGNEEERSRELERRLADGETIAVLTDAGTPGIADPGLSAVRAALRAGAAVTGVPGPSAVTLALAVSGLPADRFVFEGFLPRSGARRAERIAGLVDERRTAVLFCAPGRLGGDLADLADALGRERDCVVCRELTKLYEEVWRGRLGPAAEHWSAGARGEVTLVIAGARAVEPDPEEALALVEELVESGVSLSEAVRRVARDRGVRRRALYEEAVQRLGG